MADVGRIGPYELKGELGRGAMARVWRAWDPNLEREVAIKEPLFDPSLPEGVLEEMGRRFVAEGRAAARLNHPNVVTIHAADVWDGRPAIVMELVEGATLTALLASGPLEPAQALAVLDQLLDALGYAHGRGVVHRDVKPDNVFVSADGRVKLADFGIAHVDSGATRATVAGAVLGTPGYMSPEQARGADVDARSDLFSVGVIAYEMLTGNNPFGSGDATTLLYRIVHEDVPELPESAAAGISSDLRPAIMAALAKDPANRPATAADFRRMLHGELSLPTPSGVTDSTASFDATRDTAVREALMSALSQGTAAGTGFTQETVVSQQQTASLNATNSSSGAYEGQAGKRRSYVPYLVVGVVAVAILGIVLFSAMGSGGGSGSTGAPTANAAGTSLTMTFDGGGATGGSMTPIECAANTSVTIPKCGFLYDGHTFVGWRDESGTLVQPGETLVVQGNTTLTAVWDADQCTISYLGAGAEGSMASATVDYGTEYVLPKCAFTWSGHEFELWVDEGGMTYEPGDTLLVNGDKTLVARWKDTSQAATNAAGSGASNTSQSSQPSQSTSSSSALSASTFPRNWRGTYEGYSEFTSDNVIRRQCSMDFTSVSSGGALEAVVYIGVSENADGATTGSYAASGSIDWQTGKIHLEGTRWVNQGGLIGWGGFNGTVSASDWSISGQWYDPEGEASPGAWYMRAQ